MTVIRILLHGTPAEVLEALGKVKEGEGEYIYDMHTLQSAADTLKWKAFLSFQGWPCQWILDLQRSSMGETRGLSR